MKTGAQDRHSLVLLVSLLFFLVLSAFVRDDWISEVIVVLSMYAILIIAILKISEKRDMPWPALLLTASSLLVTLVCVFYPVHILRIANWLLLSVFFGYVSVALFSFLERAGAIIRAKLLASPGLYLILGMFYYAVLNLIRRCGIVELVVTRWELEPRIDCVGARLTEISTAPAIPAYLRLST